MKKKLIEVALPLDAINAASAREKSIRHGHPSTLHLWWARRPLAAARAVIYSQMVDDPSSHPELFPTEEDQQKERERLFDIIKDLVLWENTTNEKVLQQARDEIWKSWRLTCAENSGHPQAAELFNPDKLPAFHDPFAGRGSLPLEAQRLGLEAYASDLNPVAVLINKAMIEIPPKFAGRPPVNPESREEKTLFKKAWKGAEGLAEDVRYYGKWMRDEAEKRIGHLYPKVEITTEMVKERSDLKPYEGKKLTVIAWIWARTVKSPNPAFANVDVPLASTFMLSTKPGKEAYVEPVVEGGGYWFRVKVGKPEDVEAVKNGTKLSRGANFRCVMSQIPIESKYIYSEANARRMGVRLLAIVAEGNHGRVYLSPTGDMEHIAHEANPVWRPETPMPENPRWFSPPLYGLKTFGDLFTPRQLVALTTFSDLVQEARERVRRDYISSPPGPLSIAGEGEGRRYGGIVRNPVVTAEKSELAKAFCQQATEAEKLAWEILRDRRCLGLKFRRQQVIRGFIVDFYCPEFRLALELDGPIHDHQQAQDQKRDNALTQEGIRVLRIRNEEVTGKFLSATLSKAIASTSPDGRGSISPSPDMERGPGGEEKKASEYANAVGVYLAFAIDKGTNYWSSLCAWSTSTEKMISTFGRQALPMVWDYTEANPFSGSSGNWDLGIEQAAKMILSLRFLLLGNASQADAQSQNIAISKIVSTDPPYYDNIGYADLSDFFYVWLRQALKPIFPSLFTTMAVPKAEELVATPYRHGSKEKAETFFLDGMKKAMNRLAKQAHPGFPVTIYYAFKQAESKGNGETASTGWETFLDAVINAGFDITGTWPMRTEYTGNLKKSVSALASSIIIVCRKRPNNAPISTRREFVATLKSELPKALTHLQRGNIAPVDLAQAAIGPGMAVFTRYAKVLDSEGNPLSVREALSLINQTLDETLTEQEGDFDGDSRWAIAWFDQYGFSEGEYGVAEMLSKAKNTSVEGMVEANIVISKAGRVRLLKPGELPADWDASRDKRLTDWEGVHHLIRVLGAGGEGAAAAMVTQLGSKAETARELAYRLYTLCERKKRAAEALSYNSLVQSWPEINRLAKEQGRHRQIQKPVFNQASE